MSRAVAGMSQEKGTDHEERRWGIEETWNYNAQSTAHPFPPPTDAADEGPHSPEEVSFNEEEEEEEDGSLDTQGGQILPNPWSLP